MYGGHQVSLFTIISVVANLLSLSSNQVPTLYFFTLLTVHCGWEGEYILYLHISFLKSD